jgi:hypothetical protein
MKTKALAVRSILEMTEKRANRRQISGHFRSWVAGARSPRGTRPQEEKNHRPRWTPNHGGHMRNRSTCER